MTADRLDHAYAPDLIPSTDLDYYERAGFGGRVGWGTSPAVLVVDLTNQFSDDDWPLGRSETGDATVEATARLLSVARDHDLPVVYVHGLDADGRFDRPPVDRPGTSTGSYDPGQGNAIRAEVTPREGDVVIQKPRRSAFYGTRLDSLLREHGIDTLVVAGMVTSGCVRATVVDASQRDFRVVVPVECVGDRGLVSHEVSLFDMDMKFADVESLDDVVATVRDRFD